MICNLNADSMQLGESRHYLFEQNRLLMKISAKKCGHRARLPSKALITREIRLTESVDKLLIMVNKYYLQHSGLVSSAQRRKVDQWD